MNYMQLMQMLADEREKIPKQTQPLQEPFCSKCGVAIDFHVNLYCRKIQALHKGIVRLKNQLAEANNKS